MGDQQDSGFVLRVARMDDCDAIKALMHAAILELQKGFLTHEQIESSFAGMGLDTRLIEDGSYFAVWHGETLAGCGGWSYRSTLYGGNHSATRDDRLLDPATERARIRAMYTSPDFIRRGVARLVIAASEKAARDRGFKALEMAATMAGKPFYLSCGYHVESEWHDTNGAVPVPLATMVKQL